MAWVCERCGHCWVPRDVTRAPKACPECKSPPWAIHECDEVDRILVADRDRLAARLAEVERERDEAEDFRSEIVIDAFTAPDADWDTILDSLRSRIQDLATTPLDDLVYDAWAVIANVGHKQGGWEAQDPEWVEAAIRWRDRFHESLRDGWEECPDCGAPQVTDHGDGTWSCPNRECVNADPASDQLPVPEQTTAEPDRCPTCESVDQTKCGNPRYPQHDHGAFPLCCPDPWHRAPYDDEGYVAYQDLGEWLGILPAAEPEVGP